MKIDRNPTLTAARLREVLDYCPETGGFAWRVSSNGRVLAGSVAGSPAHSGHIRISIDKRLHMAHRLAWLYVHGSWPVSTIDHINGIPSDNSIANLREATHAQNMENQNRAHSNNKTGLLGVSQKDGRFIATIGSGKELFYIGTFDTPELAHAAYLDAKNRLHAFGTIGNSEERGIDFMSRRKYQKLTPRKGSKSGILGVSLSGGRWRATAFINGKTVHVGCFATKEEAADARDRFVSENTTHQCE